MLGERKVERERERAAIAGIKEEVAMAESPAAGDRSMEQQAVPLQQTVPSSSSSSSKRKWSPCTWRYAIEETQAELGSKQRSYPPSFSAPSAKTAAAPSPDRHLDSDRLHPHWSSSKKGAGGEEKEDGPKRVGNGFHKKFVMKDSENPEDRMRRRKKKEALKRRAEKEGSSTALTSTITNYAAEETCHASPVIHSCGGGGGKTSSDDRRKREMTPSELYFCDVCSGRTPTAPAEGFAGEN